MEEVIAKKYPNFTIQDYDGVGHEIISPIAYSTSHHIKVPVTKMTEEEKEECDEAYHKIVELRLLVMNKNKNYAHT